MHQTNVLRLQRLQIAPRLRDEREDALDGVNLGGDLREHRRLIAAAGTDLQHARELASGARELGHPRDYPWLRDRLAAADRERRIFVRADRERFVYEDV